MGIFKKATPDVTTTPEVTEEVTASAPVIGDSANELTASLREAVKTFPLASQMNTHIDAIEQLMFVK